MGESNSTVNLVDKIWRCHKHNKNYVHKHPKSKNLSDYTYEWPKNWYCPICNRIDKWLMITFIGLLSSVPLGFFSIIIAIIIENPIILFPSVIVSIGSMISALILIICRILGKI